MVQARCQILAILLDAMCTECRSEPKLVDLSIVAAEHDVIISDSTTAGTGI